MQINKNRQLITLEETLAYIKYLNREQPFTKDEVLIPTKDYEELTQQQQPRAVTPLERAKRTKPEALEDEDLSKKINKNRAIKRIIESAFQILQSFKSYEEPGDGKGDKSADIQFNIYLKQYNRVLEMIYNKEKEQVSRRAQTTQRHQELLQSIYEYTVVQDFREVLPVAILKDKISKNNVEIMIKALSDCLVVLRSNELRVHEPGGIRTIKLHQIQNVDYHTQPYIFIVLTIQKDKERFNIYLRFDSQKNQQKWDRALYCCYIGRKMKTKEKFFLLEYPQQDVKKKEKEETKKQAAFHYDLDTSKLPLKHIFAQNRTNSISSRKQPEDDAASRSNNSHARKMSITKTLLKNNSSKQEQPEEAFPIIGRTASELGIKGTFRSNKQLTVIDSDAGGQERGMSPDKDSLINRNKTDYIQINKSQKLQPPEQDYTERNPIGSFSQIDEEQRQRMGQQQVQELQKEMLPDDIRRIHDLQRKNVKGILLQKDRFFFNKPKLAFFKENQFKQKAEQQQQEQDIQSEYEAMRQRELEYWDFDIKSGEKSERKAIRNINITKYELREQSLLIVHQNNKEIIFLGDESALKEVYEWINLIHNIYKTKLVPKTPFNQSIP